MPATVGAGGGVVFSPGVRVLPWRSAEGRQGNPTAGRSTGERRIQTGRAAGVPRLLGEAARLVGGADSGDPGSRPGRGGTALRCPAWESVCTSVCGEPAWDWGSRGRERRALSRRRYSGRSRRCAVSRKTDHCLPRPGFFWEGVRNVHQVLTAPLRKVWTASGWAEIWTATVQSGAGASGSDRSHPRGIAGAPRPEVVGGRATSLEPDPDPLGPHRVSGAARY